MKKTILTAAIAALSVYPALSAELPLTSDVRESGALSIASGLDYAPFEYTDEKGDPAGMDVELAHAAADLMGVKLDLKRIPFASQIPALTAGRIKVAWATFTVKEDRLKQVDFVTFLKSGTVAAVLPENLSKFQNQDSLCGAKVAVQTGSAADFTTDKLSGECTKAGKSAIDKIIYPEQKDTIQAVLTGRADVRLDDSTAAGYYQKTSGGKLVVAPGVYDVLPLGVAVPKGDAATAEMMRVTLQTLIDNGTYAAILEKYGMSLAAVEKSRIITSVDQIAE